MNILLDRLPETVQIDGLQYPINTDFRISILFEMLLADPELTEEEKLVQALNLYFPLLPINVPAALEQILWFYRGGKEQQTATEEKRSVAVYDFAYDDTYIYAAFLDQYGLDLQDVAHLHWWKFKALFAGLREDMRISKIMGYRAMEIPKDMPKAQKDFYTKMKKLYQIPQRITEAEKEMQNTLEAALMGDGDLTGLL